MLQSMGSQRVRHDLATGKKQFMEFFGNYLCGLNTHTHTHTHTHKTKQVTITSNCTTSCPSSRRTEALEKSKVEGKAILQPEDLLPDVRPVHIQADQRGEKPGRKCSILR